MMDRCKQQADNTASATASTAAAKTVYIYEARSNTVRKLFLQQIVHYVHARTITEKPPYLLIVLVAYNWLTVLSGAQ
jgi:hypothetical protein